MARTPRNYRAEWNALQASKRGREVGQPLSGHEKYLRRMADAQRKAEAAGRDFKPQQARGHKPQEHKTPARERAHQRYARERFYERRERRQQKWFDDVSMRLSGETMIRQEERWSTMTPDHRQRVIDARTFALAHRGMYSWDWYVDEFGLDDEDREVFAYD